MAAGLAGSTSTSEWDSAQRSLLAALGLSIVAFIVQFSGLFFGWTMFVNRLNMCHVVLHFFGGVLTAWYLVDQWGYLSFWYVAAAAAVHTHAFAVLLARTHRLFRTISCVQVLSGVL